MANWFVTGTTRDLVAEVVCAVFAGDDDVFQAH